VALTATIHRFEIDLSHVDRSMYEKLDLRVAQHPSEKLEFMVARVLAYAFFLEEGIAFSKGGISDTEVAPIAVHSLDGQLRTWIDIGVPSADRLHKASKAADRVVVLTHRNTERIKAELAKRDIHKRESLELYSVEESLIADVVRRVDRNNTWGLTFSDGQVYITISDDTLSGPLARFYT
jgi:uncharacterized protein YaeQ